MPRTDLYRFGRGGAGRSGLRGVFGAGVHGLRRASRACRFCQLYPVDRALAEWDDLRGKVGRAAAFVHPGPQIPFGVAGWTAGPAALADRHGMLITMHVNENDEDDRATLTDYGRRTIPFLDELGFWGPDVLAVHCVKMQPEDIEIFARHDVKVSHNPVSNMYWAWGSRRSRRCARPG